MSILRELDWLQVISHYQLRVRIHERLLELYQQEGKTDFCELVLGISDSDSNYSAAEHGLGPRIWGSNPNIVGRLSELARQFIELKNARTVPELIRAQSLKYLQIGVGSEISCLLNPTVCWVANTRTLWAHLLITHNDNVNKANEALMLYRDPDAESEMSYQKWSALHAELNPTMTRLAEDGEQSARRDGLTPGTLKFLWADAIASELYEKYVSGKSL